jgi:predicted ferric reductase
MLGKHWMGRRMTIEDVLAYVATLLMVMWIFKLLPASVMTTMVWAFLWRAAVVVGLLIAPLSVVIVLVRKYLQLVTKA